MDGLIALLIVIAIANALTSGKRKKRQEAQRRAFQSAQQAQAAAQGAKAQPRQRSSYPGAGVPTPEELRARPAAPSPEHVLRPAAPQVSVTRRGEGSTSTQGESEAEHAEHQRRVAAEEAARRLERETLRDLREANREKLRAAVVMSEVLGKPVALRARTGLHR